MKYKYRAKRPKRDQLHGMSPSELKTLLKRRGYKIGRDFFKYGVLHDTRIGHIVFVGGILAVSSLWI
jgi:hypothetical protein